MAKQKVKVHFLVCDEPGCGAEVKIKAQTNPPGFLPVKEIMMEAEKIGWHADILARKIFCPKHKITEKKETS